MNQQSLPGSKFSSIGSFSKTSEFDMGAFLNMDGMKNDFRGVSHAPISNYHASILGYSEPNSVTGTYSHNVPREVPSQQRHEPESFPQGQNLYTPDLFADFGFQGNSFPIVNEYQQARNQELSSQQEPFPQQGQYLQNPSPHGQQSFKQNQQQDRSYPTLSSHEPQTFARYDLPMTSLERVGTQEVNVSNSYGMASHTVVPPHSAQLHSWPRNYISPVKSQSSHRSSGSDISSAQGKSSKDLIIEELRRQIETLKAEIMELKSGKGSLGRPRKTSDDETRPRSITNRRPANIANFDATQHYQPLSGDPDSWAWDGWSNHSHFKYTRFGELVTATRFNGNDIYDYIFCWRNGQVQNFANDTGFPAGLTLWIQNVPADSGNRYPDAKQSAKCRFIDCPAKNNTIRKGEYRVCFDEWSLNTPENTSKDPYHNAGYVHLYCLEKFTDFSAVCKFANVFGDNRKFREGRNKMAITRDSDSMLEVVEQHIATCQPLNDQPKPDNWFEYSLTKKLTEEHISKQPAVRQIVRSQRGGNSLDQHLGNLDFQQVNVKPRKNAASSKRQREEEEDDDDEDEEDDIDFMPRPSKKAKKNERRVAAELNMATTTPDQIANARVFAEPRRSARISTNSPSSR